MQRGKVERKTSCMLLFILVILSFLASIAFVPDAPEAAPPKKILRLMCGTASVTSGHYPSSVIVAKVVNEKVPEVNISLVETAGAFECVFRTGKDLDMYAQTGYSAPVARYNGISRFSGKADKNLRVLYQYSTSVYMFMVRADSGVKTLKDLAGKRYFLGPAGSSAGTNSKQLLDALGIKIEQAFGSVPDSVTMTQDRRIVGFHKAAAAGEIDATMWEVKAFTPIRILSFTKEEIDVANKLIPGWFVITMPVVKGVEEQGPISTWVEPAGAGASKKMPEEVVYKMIKAISENWKQIREGGNPTVVNITDVVEPTISYTSAVKGADPVPLHAGVVRYFTELGKKIPASLIPPEYKK